MGLTLSATSAESKDLLREMSLVRAGRPGAPPRHGPENNLAGGRTPAVSSKPPPRRSFRFRCRAVYLFAGEVLRGGLVAGRSRLRGPLPGEPRRPGAQPQAPQAAGAGGRAE